MMGKMMFDCIGGVGGVNLSVKINAKFIGNLLNFAICGAAAVGSLFLSQCSFLVDASGGSARYSGSECGGI